MLPVERAIARRFGVATTAEILSDGIEREFIMMARDYGRITRVRKGVWALPSTPRDVIEARRIGGRLACISAARHHGIDLSYAGLHVSLARNASRLRTATALVEPIVLHWSRDQLPGDSVSVTLEIALRQMQTCLSELRVGG